VERLSWNDARTFCEKLGQKTDRTVRLPSEAEWEYACRAGSKTPFHPPNAPPLTDAQRRRVAELIPRLGSDEFEVRDKATRDLIALEMGILPLLDKVKVDDPEVQVRLAAVRAAFQPRTDLDSVAWHRKNSVKRPLPVGEKKPNAFGLYDMHGNVWELCEDDWHDNYEGAPKDGRAWVNNPRGGVRVLRGGSWNFIARACRSAFRYGGAPGFRADGVGFRVLLSSSPRTP